MSTDNLKTASDSQRDHFVALKMLKHLEKKKKNQRSWDLYFKLMSGSEISKVVWVLGC